MIELQLDGVRALQGESAFTTACLEHVGQQIKWDDLLDQLTAERNKLIRETIPPLMNSADDAILNHRRTNVKLPREGRLHLDSNKR